jgi:predicted RNA binding protein YcfA (HicA-like mRNA interferase family)
MSVADKLHQRQMALRKKSGLPHPDYYKALGKSYDIQDDKERLTHQSELKKKYGVKEEVEMLDEMPESSMKTRDVHAHLKKSGWALARSSGGHDVYKHPKAKHSIPVPRHNQLKAPLIRGIMKASRVSEETEIEEQLEKKGRFVSGPPKKTFKASTIVSPIREAKDPREYDYEGDMAMSQLRSLMFNAQDMMDLMEENTNLPEWVQSKITLAEDYISTAANYLRGELNEEVKDEYARKVDKYLKKKYNKEEVEIVDEGIVGKVISKVINKLHSSNAKRPLPQPSDRREYEKPKMEEVELQEVAKWRKTSVAKINPDHDPEDWASGRSYDYYHDNPRSTGNLKATSDTDTKYHSLSARPKAEISSQGPRKGMITKQHTQRLKDRIKSSLKKEEVELQEGRPSQRHPLEGHDYHKKSNAELIGIAKDAHAAAEAMKGHSPQSENKYRDQANDSATVRYFRQKSGMPDWYKKKYGHVKEEAEQLDEKNVPTSPEKWAQAKAQAKSKFDVYPSAYANGWAAKKYKEMGGGWKSVNENTDEPSAAARTLSRKAQIVRDAAKGKKQEQEEASDKFQKDPELSSDMQKT